MNAKVLKVALPALVLVVLAGVGGFAWGLHTSSPSVTSVAERGSATAHNAADIRFAQMMVPHHQQAVTMADDVDARGGSAAVQQLAAQIRAAQQPEIDAMTDWLSAWGSKPSQGRMSGMMSSGEMSSLTTKSGAAFDKAWLTMMIAHHTGALRMARDELAHGRSSQALGLASSIVVTQQAEIAEMRAMLG